MVSAWSRNPCKIIKVVSGGKNTVGDGKNVIRDANLVSTQYVTGHPMSDSHLLTMTSTLHATDMEAHTQQPFFFLDSPLPPP